MVPGHDRKSGTWRLSTSASNLGSQNMLLLNGVAIVNVSGRDGKVLTFIYNSGAPYVSTEVGSNTQRMVAL